MVDWDKELAGIDLSLDGPSSFAVRLSQDRGFRSAAGWLVAGWPKLDAETRSGALGALATVAIAALPETTKADAGAIAQAVVQVLRRTAARSYAAGDVSEDTLREIIGAALPRRHPGPPAAPRALRYPDAYYRDALTLSLPAWACRWWPGLDISGPDYDRVAERRRRARRTARQRGIDKQPTVSL